MKWMKFTLEVTTGFILSSNQKLISTEISGNKQAKLKLNSKKVAKFLSKIIMLSETYMITVNSIMKTLGR